MRFDVLAIGGGFAGLIAANRCAQFGLRAAVLEKETAERYLSNSRYTTGVSHILFQNMRLPEETLLPVIEKATCGHARPELIKVIAANSRRAIEWLTEEGARFMEMYTSTGLSLILAPPRRFKQGLDWEGRGPDVMLRKLEENLVKRGGQLMRGVKAERLVIKEGACVGVDAVQNARSVRFEATSVVIADGGFSSNVDMIRRYITPRADRLLLRGAANSMGDGLRMAEEAGAELRGFGQFYGHPVHREAYTESNPDLWPFPMIDPLAQTGIVVGADGKRFADEGRGGIVLSNLMAQLEDPLSTTLVFDDKLWNTVGKESPSSPNPMIFSIGASLYKADDLKTLAAMAQLPPDALAATVGAYNDALGRNIPDKLDPPRSMRPVVAQAIVQSPYYAMPLCSGITATMGGISIDAGCRALRADGSAIPGLYAAGSTVSGIEGGPSVAYMGGLSKAFIFGLLAGEAIASDAGRSSSAIHAAR